jgi:hypothetical protein
MEIVHKFDEVNFKDSRVHVQMDGRKHATGYGRPDLHLVTRNSIVGLRLRGWGQDIDVPRHHPAIKVIAP